jgi:hypothetical protein
MEPLLLALTLLYLLYEMILSHVEGDQAYLLYAAQRMLQGVQLDGPRLIETNPPLIVWFNEIPAGIGSLLHLDAVLALRLVTLGMLAASMVWTRNILRKSNIAKLLGGSATRLLWFFSATAVLFIRPAEFGQREQLLAVLLVPYVLAVATDTVTSMTLLGRVLIGFTAGLAISFKPHHVLTLVCLELFLALNRRTLKRLVSAELLSSIAACLFYVASVRIFTPPYLKTIVPLLNSTYWALGEFSLAQMAFQRGLLITLWAAASAALWLLLRRRLALSQLSGALIASGIGATLAYFIQHTGWYHQEFPAVVFLEIGAVCVALDFLQSSFPTPLHFLSPGPITWGASVFCAVLIFAYVDVRGYRHDDTSAALNSELEGYAPGTTVYAFTLSLSEFPVVLQNHLVWGSRFAHLWLLPAIYSNEVPVRLPGRSFQQMPPERVAELAAIQRDQLTEDLNRTQPSYIFVEQCTRRICEGFTSPIDMLAWFSRSPAFTQTWSHYRFQKTVTNFDVYQRQ